VKGRLHLQLLILQVLRFPVLPRLVRCSIKLQSDGRRLKSGYPKSNFIPGSLLCAHQSDVKVLLILHVYQFCEVVGHSSIQVTVDTHGHMVPGADIVWADKLDAAATIPQVSATQTPTEENEPNGESPQLLENIRGPARIRT
jgi:hypothetical protein